MPGESRTLSAELALLIIIRDAPSPGATWTHCKAQMVEHGYSLGTVSKAQDMLMDQGQIVDEWAKVDGLIRRVLRVHPHAVGFAKALTWEVPRAG